MTTFIAALKLRMKPATPLFIIKILMTSIVHYQSHLLVPNQKTLRSVINSWQKRNNNTRKTYIVRLPLTIKFTEIIDKTRDSRLLSYVSTVEKFEQRKNKITIPSQIKNFKWVSRTEVIRSVDNEFISVRISFYIVIELEKSISKCFCFFLNKDNFLKNLSYVRTLCRLR